MGRRKQYTVPVDPDYVPDNGHLNLEICKRCPHLKRHVTWFRFVCQDKATGTGADASSFGYDLLRFIPEWCPYELEQTLTIRKGD